MAAANRQTRLFGLDLAPLWQAMVAAWGGMLAWPLFSWLRPKLPVCLWTISGQALLSHGPATPALVNASAVKKAVFSALLLPESLLLRQTVDLPALPPDQCIDALRLAIVGLSPFAPDDLVWSHESAQQLGAPLATNRHHLVLASRKNIGQHIAQAHPDLNPAQLEIWVQSAVLKQHLLLPGFAEAARLRRTRVWQRVSATLALLVIGLLLAMALTPSAQLYLRALQANQANEALGVLAAPVIAERDKMVQAFDQLAGLRAIIGAPIPPARVLKLLTEALPDDTSLLSLQIQGLKVTMSGQSADAAALMKRLDATSGLRNITAPTPAVKPLGAARESFSIELTLDPKLIP
jgi:general secretion pathway protein L